MARPKKNPTPPNGSYLTIGKPVYDIAGQKESNAFGETLKEARERKQISPFYLVQQLAACGAEVSEETLNAWEAGTAAPDPYILFALCWILDIRDPLYTFTQSVPDIGLQTSTLNDTGRRKVQAYVRDLLASGLYARKEADSESAEPARRSRSKNVSKNLAALPTNEIKMRVYSVAVSAGVGNFLSDDNYEEILVPDSALPAGADYGLRVSGDSMLPTYTDGQLVWVQKCDTLNSGEIGIFVYDSNAYIKKLSVERVLPPGLEPYTEETDAGDMDYRSLDLSDVTLENRIRLLSLNPKYRPILVSPDMPFTVLGRVLN